MSTAESRTGTTHFDLDALKRAIHDGDRETMLSLYADDAEVLVFDKNNPPSTPSMLTGRENIGAMLADVFSRDMTHDVTRAVADDTCAAYEIACRYSDGTRVVATSMLDLRDGRIVHEEMVQAWDD